MKEKNIIKEERRESCHLVGLKFKGPKNILHKIYPCSVNASRECYGGGRWAETTNYNHCLCNSTDPAACALDTAAADTDTPALEISIIIYLIGATILLYFLFNRGHNALQCTIYTQKHTVK